MHLRGKGSLVIHSHQTLSLMYFYLLGLLMVLCLTRLGEHCRCHEFFKIVPRNYIFIEILQFALLDKKYYICVHRTIIKSIKLQEVGDNHI